MPPPADGGVPRTRDERIDLFRGAALLLIFIDHVEWLNGVRLVSPHTLGSLGFCDAMEAFIFISGYVCGLSYWPVFAGAGFLACQAKALRRVAQLWAANLATLWVVFNLVMACSDRTGAHFASYRLGGLSDPLGRLLPRVLLQFYQPALFDVLTLYMYLLLVLPVFLYGASRRPRVTWAIVLGAYAAAQLVPWLSYPMYDAVSGRLSGAARLFNPFAWQLLFFVGCVVGMRRANSRRLTIPRPVVWVCLVAVVGVAILKQQTPVEYRGPVEGVAQQGLQAVAGSWLALKQTEGPARLVSFFMLAAVAASAVPERLGPRARRVLGGLVACGRNPLPVFCLGVVLTYAAHPVLAASARPRVVLPGIEILGCGAMLLAGVLLCRWRAPSRRPGVSPSTPRLESE